jgi:O-antigen/teichoic acid export membrane protein
VDGKGTTLSAQPVVEPIEITTEVAAKPEPKAKPRKSSEPLSASVLTTAKGSGIIAFGKMVETVGRIVVAFLLARMLGADDFGQYTLALATSALVASVGKLGLDSAAVRYIAILRNRHDEAGVRGVLQLCLAISLGAGVLLGAGLYFGAGTIALSVYQEPKLVTLLQLAGLMVPLAVVNDLLIGASRGFKRMHYSVIAQDIAHLVIRLTLIAALWVTGANAFWAVATYGIADLFSILILIFLLNNAFSWKGLFHGARYETGELLRFSLPLFLSEMLKRFRGDIQTILLGALYTVTSVGVFSAANKINVVSRVTSLSLMTSSEPAFAELHAKGDKAQMSDLYAATSRWMFILNFPVVLLTVLFATPILRFLGESFVSGANALILLSLASLVNISTGLGGTIIDMTGYTKLKLINSVAQIVLFVATSVLLIPPFGVIGAASAAMISSSIIQIARMVQVQILFKMQPYDKWFVKAVAAAAITTALGYLMRYFLATDRSLLLVIIHSLLLTGLYVGLLLLFGLAPQDRDLGLRLWDRMVAFLPGRKKLKPAMPTGSAD